jgi:xylulokinase
MQKVCIAATATNTWYGSKGKRQSIMYIGLDIGTGSVKAAVIIGEELAFYGASYPPGAAQVGRHDTAGVARTIQSLFGEIAEAQRRHISSLKGIAMSGHGPSLLAAGPDGNPLTDILTWQDHSAGEEEKIITENFPGFDWGGSSYEGKSMALFRKKPELFSRGVKLFYPKDYISFLLTGNGTTDRSTASTLVFWNDEKQVWDCRDTGMTEEFFPPVVEPWEASGQTGTEWSRSCGLPDGVPVYGGGIDAYCESVGVGAVREGDIVDGSGTSTCISLALPEHMDTLSGDRHVLPGLRLHMETMSYTGGSLQWLLDMLGQDIETAKKGAESAPVNILFLPWLIGERSPVWDKKASGAFIGLRHDTTREQMFAALFQGCVFGIRQNLELLANAGAFMPASGRVIAAGGGARNDQWMQIKADVTGREYAKPVYPEAAPLGDALLALFGREGGSPSDLAMRFIKTEKVFTPEKNRQTRERYDRLYNLYCGMYEQLKQTFHGLAAAEG